MAPVAMAGKDQNVLIGARVTLDGSGSWDANDDPLVFKWALTSKPAGSTASMISAAGVRPMFVADVAGTYIATLIISDGRVDSQPSTVTVTASRANAAPVANAGDNQNVQTGVVITLDGSASSDANRDQLTYRWTLTTRPVGSKATLTGADQVNPTFKADLPGTYIASLIVNDGVVDSRPSTVTIYASQANSAPVANAGSDQSVSRGTSVKLDGSLSSDNDKDPLTYRWTILSKPAGSTTILNAPSTVRPTLFVDVAGDYLVRLVVNDGKEDSQPATVTISVASGNSAPTANAGPAQNVATNSIVTLDGSQSFDTNGDPLSYRWVLTSRPVGSQAKLLAATSANPTFIVDLPGSYVATLIVNDGELDSAPANVTISASQANAVPVANAGAPQTVAIGATVTLNGGASSDADGNPLTYAWTMVSKPTGSTAALSSATAVAPTFVADVAGDYVLRLVVNDGTASSLPSTVTITAATTSELALWQILGPTTQTQMSWPYSTQSTVSGVTCVPAPPATSCTVTLASFKVTAPSDRNLTISDLTATNLTTGSAVVASFSGLTNNQMVTAGSTAAFDLRSTLTNNVATNLRYQFKVLETGQTFDYRVNLTTNP